MKERIALGTLLFVFSAAILSAQTNVWVSGGTIGSSGNSNVGIGTSSPASRLHIGGTKQELRIDYNGTSNYYGALRWAGLQLGNNGANRIIAGRTATGGWLEFYVNNTNNAVDYAQTPDGTLAMKIGSNGRVGIGTTDPSSLLEVDGTFRVVGNGMFGNSWAGNVAAYPLHIKNSGGASLALEDTESSNQVFVLRSSYGDGLKIIDETASAERVRIDTSGNVGIGTTNPLYKLDVGGILGVTYTNPVNILRDSDHVHSSPGVVGYISLRDSNGTEYGWVGDGSGGDNYMSLFAGTQHGVQLGAGGYPRMWVATGGNVGIGTSTPSHKLAVNGTIRAKEIIVDTGWADYVFAEGYDLAPLSEVEAHIEEMGHLPDIPSATDVAINGVSVGEMQSLLLAKIEELTLHTISQQKQIEELLRGRADAEAELRKINQQLEGNFTL